MNNVSFVGRLTADPDEPTTTPTGKKVVDLRVAINHFRRAAALLAAMRDRAMTAVSAAAVPRL